MENYIIFCVAVWIFMATVSTLGSFLTLIIIWRMRSQLQTNTYLRIVLIICLCQMMYDWGLYFEISFYNTVYVAGEYEM